jgi:hypothetical protein
VVGAPGRRERVTGRRRLCAGRVCAARGAADRAVRGRIGNAAQRRRVRFQRGLAAGKLLELSLELLLVEQLPAGGAIDLRAQFGEAVFVGELLLGLTRDEPSECVVAEREIGRGRADQPAMTTTDPTAIQNATGPNLICRPAWVIV